MTDTAPRTNLVLSLLEAHHFTTIDACQCDGVAVVAVVADPADLVSEARRLLEVLAAAGVTVQPLSPDGDGPEIQASFDPADGSAVLALHGVTDELLAA